MNIIEGSVVDLIEPFPLTQSARAVGWLHCCRTLFTSDDGPQGAEELKRWIEDITQLPNVRSWGVIDKNQTLNIRHEAPLVGFLIFERQSLRNGYLHVATTRRSWGSGLIDDAAKIGLKQLFTDTPELLRVSGLIVKHNAPAKAFVKRVGFSTEGLLRDYMLQDGIPKDVLHFGLTRQAWMEQQASVVPVEQVVE